MGWCHLWNGEFNETMKLFYLFMAGVVIACTAIGVSAVKLLDLELSVTGSDANTIIQQNDYLRQ